VTTRLRVVGADEALPPPDGFSALELDCRRCRGHVSAVRWPGGRWTLAHECVAPPRSRAQRFLEWRAAPDVAAAVYAVVLLVVLTALVAAGK
jgi:hypothetical protein